MDFDTAVKNYVALRSQCEVIDREAKKSVAALKEKMKMLETWITLKADEEGLKNVPSMHGTAYWSTHYSCTTAEVGTFFEYVRDHDAWELLEKRPSKTGVKSFIDENGAPPPGVNFSAIRVFNVKTTKE